MTRSHDVNTPRPTEEALRSLVEVGTHLADKADRRKVLDLILLEARRLAGAEAGSLYLLKDGRLRFVSAQNDKVPLTQITEVFLDHEMPWRPTPRTTSTATSTPPPAIARSRSWPPPCGAPTTRSWASCNCSTAWTGAAR
jgi:hypothetical protein